jgi:molybdopterin converting factor subunit 1
MRVLFFAQLKDVTGCSECSVAADGPLTTDALWTALLQRFPELQAQRAILRLARNWEYTGPDVRFDNNDEIALIPPVSGG